MHSLSRLVCFYTHLVQRKLGDTYQSRCDIIDLLKVNKNLSSLCSEEKNGEKLADCIIAFPCVICNPRGQGILRFMAI